VNRSTAILQEAGVLVLGRVLAAFDRAGIAALPVKGVVTARLLYDDPGERTIRDVDVRIAPADYPRAVEVARAEGWRVKTQADAYYNLFFELGGVDVDVEGGIGPPGLCALRVEDMIARARRGPMGWLEPDPIDHALVLVVNAFKDKLVALAPWSLEDLRRIVRRDDVAPHAVAARAREAGVETIAWIVSDWMAREGGDVGAAWRAVRDAVGPRPRRARYAAVFRWLLQHGRHDSLAMRLWARAGADRWWMRGRALWVAARWTLDSKTL
jgi:hypothetical protein